MNIIRIIGAVILIAFVSSSNNTYGTANRTTGRDRFIGTWELKLIEILQPSGEWIHWKDGRFGPNPIGIGIYDSAGNMAVQIMASKRPAVDSSEIISDKVPPEKIRAVIIGYVAYFGTYEVNEKEDYVVHHRRGSLFSKRVGTSAKRFFKFIDNRLILTIPSRERRFIWRRLNSSNGD